MLILVYGSLGLDYLIRNVLPNNDWVMTMLCPGNDSNIGIDVGGLNPGIIMRVAIMWSKILDLRDDDMRLLLDSLMNSSRLHDAVNYIIETYQDYNASRLTTS